MRQRPLHHHRVFHWRGVAAALVAIFAGVLLAEVAVPAIRERILSV